MKRIIVVLVSLFICSCFAAAQDYYLTKDNNLTALKLDNFSDINNILREEKKASKYQPVYIDIGEKEAVFVLVPNNFKQQMDEGGLLLVDKTDEDIVIEVEVKANLSLAAAIAEIKMDNEDDTKLSSERRMILNGRPVQEIVYDNPQSTKAYIYLISYKKVIVFSVSQDPKWDVKYNEVLKDIVSSLGTVELTGKGAAPVVEGIAESSQPAAEEKLTAVNRALEEAAAKPAPKQQVSLGYISVDKKDAKANTVSFSSDDNSYAFDLPPNIDPYIRDGRIFFKSPLEGKNAFFMEIPGPKTAEYYNNLLKEQSGITAMRSLPSQKGKAGRKPYSITRKVGLNRVAVNYFIKEKEQFAISFMSESKDEKYFDNISKVILISLREDIKSK